MNLGCLVALSLIAASAAVSAQPSAMTMIAYAGRCHSLILFDRPEHRRCADTIATIALDDGRSGYAFTLGDGTIVAFTAPASGRSVTATKTTLAVDQVNFVFRNEGSPMAAIGTCEAEDPTIWRASIKCEANTTNGRVAGEFSSTGEPGKPVFNNVGKP